MNYDKLTKEQLLGIHKDTLEYLNEQEQEIERLNNIINEFEKRLNKLRVELKSLYVGEWGDTEDEAEEKINYIELGEDND